MRATPMSAKEYVESLHQNSRSTLLYGKNNVMVQPVSDDVTHDDVMVTLILPVNVDHGSYIQP